MKQILLQIVLIWQKNLKKPYLTLLFGPPLVLEFELPIPLEPLPELGLRKLVLSRKYKLISMLKPFQMQTTPIFSMNKKNLFRKINGKKCLICSYVTNLFVIGKFMTKPVFSMYFTRSFTRSCNHIEVSKFASEIYWPLSTTQFYAFSHRKNTSNFKIIIKDK